MPGWNAGPGVPRGARRGPYRKARRGASAPNRRRLKKRLRDAMEAYGGPGKWVVRKVSANHYTLQRVNLDEKSVLLQHFSQAPSPYLSLRPPFFPLHTLFRHPFLTFLPSPSFFSLPCNY